MRLLVLIAAAWLAGCSTLPDIKPVAEPSAQIEASWQARQLKMAGLAQWQLQGRVSITSDHEAWFLKANWQQKAEQVFDLHLSGPFNGGVHLAGNEQQVVFSDGDQTFIAPDAEMLLLEHTGIRMPVNGLRYWLVGLPQPDKEIKALKLDANGRLVSLEQGEWRVEIKGYQLQGETEVPSKLSIINHRIKVRLIVDQWTLATRTL